MFWDQSCDFIIKLKAEQLMNPSAVPAVRQFQLNYINSGNNVSLWRFNCDQTRLSCLWHGILCFDLYGFSQSIAGTKKRKKNPPKKIGIFWYNVPYFIPVNVWLCLAFTKNNKLVIMHIVTCYFVESVCRLRRYTYRKHQSTDRSAAGHQMSDFPSGSRQCAFLDEQQYGPIINNQSITSH